MQSLFPQCYQWVICCFMTISEVKLCLIENLYLMRPKQSLCSLFPSVTTKLPATSRPSSKYSSTYLKSHVSQETSKVIMQSFPCSVMTEWPAIAKPSPECKSNDSKSSVPGDINSDHGGSPSQCHHKIACHFKNISEYKFTLCCIQKSRNCSIPVLSKPFYCPKVTIIQYCLLQDHHTLSK